MLTASLPVPGRQRKLKVHGTRNPATPDQPPQAASSSSSSQASTEDKLEEPEQHQLEDAPSSSPAAPPSVSGSSDWEPSSPISAADSSDKSDPSESQEVFGEEICHKEPKYIVFGSSLGQLLQWCHCPSCGSVDIRQVWTTTGTLLKIHLTCDSCLQATKWHSQPSIGNFPAGNMLLSAGILFAGASPTKVLRVLDHMGVMTYEKRTFFSHQRDILQPAIQSVWTQQQAAHIAMLQTEGRPLILGGDGRADSPGHSAKFGTYTTMELEANVVLDLQLVQVQFILFKFRVLCEKFKTSSVNIVIVSVSNHIQLNAELLSSYLPNWNVPCCIFRATSVVGATIWNWKA